MTAEEYDVTHKILKPHIMHDIALVQGKLRDNGAYTYQGLDLHPAMAEWSDSTLGDYLTSYILDKHYHENGIIVDEEI